MHRIVVAVAALSLAAGAVACAKAAASPEAERAAVSQALTEYRQAWLANDQEGVMRRVAEDFMLFPPGATSKTVVGKAAIRPFWFPASDTVYRITKYDVSDQQIHLGDGLAVEQGTSILSWDTVARDSVLSSSSSTNEYLTVLRKEQDGWKLIRSMHVPR
jgi:ketosteroid isomerase-like protein